MDQLDEIKHRADTGDASASDQLKKKEIEIGLT